MNEQTESDATSRPFTVAEAAKTLGKSPARIYEAVSRGDLPSFRIGGRIYIARAAFERLLSEGR